MFDKFGRGVITWRELSALLKALGIPDIPLSLLHRMSAECTPENSAGLDYKQFLQLFHAEPFADSLDYTYNRHNSSYNVRVVKKALALLVEGFLTLEDLRSSRMGFALYEGETCNGIQLDGCVVAAVMRVTGKAIAPKKLQSWLDAIEEDVPGRLQLYEFLDLVKLCNDRGEQARAVPNNNASIERSRIGLFELADSNFLLTPNQKLAKHMDDDYDGMMSTMNAQQTQPRETSIAAKSTSPEFNYGILYGRKSKKSDESIELYGQIRDTIKSSASNLSTAKATGIPPSRPRTAASFVERNPHLPALHLSAATLRPSRERRSTSAPTLRSFDSQRTSRMSDVDSVSFDMSKIEHSIPRHLTASAPPLRSSFSGKDKNEGTLDNPEHNIPERKLDNYETLRDYLANNGEASLSRIITSSIGASYKPPTSPPSPHTKLERNKPKPKRQEDARKNTKNLQSIYRDRIAKGSPSANLEELFAKASSDIARAQSMRKQGSDDSELEYPTFLTPNVEENMRPRPKSSGDHRITFQL